MKKSEVIRILFNENVHIQSVAGMLPENGGKFTLILEANYDLRLPDDPTLRQVRLSKRLNSKQMAEMLKLHPVTYWQYENGKRPVPAHIVHLALAV